MTVQKTLFLTAEILGHLMNQAGPACWGPYSQKELSDCINLCFALSELIRLAEVDRAARPGAETEDKNDES